jgi:GntR family transcriptional repressor for pyruvate dehydrogenase complex
MSPVSRSVVPVSMSEAVATHLRQRIHAGDYSPGDRLPTQRDLAAQLGVARVSVREGIKQLVDDGYLEVRRGAAGGAFVTELSQPLEAWRQRLRSMAGELDELIDFRIAVEAKAASLAAERSSRAELADMRAALKALRSLRAPGPDSRSAFRVADGQFHDALARAARNRRLERVIREARLELFTPYDLLTFAEPVQPVLDDHQAIYEAVRDGSSVRAAELMAEHIEHTRQQLRSFVHDSH